MAQSKFAKLLLAKKKKQMERQAETRARLDEEAEQQREAERRRRAESLSLPRTPPPPNSPPFRLHTPTPPWEIEGRHSPALTDAEAFARPSDAALSGLTARTGQRASASASPTGIKADINIVGSRRASPDTQDVYSYLKDEPNSDDDLYLDPNNPHTTHQSEWLAGEEHVSEAPESGSGHSDFYDISLSGPFVSQDIAGSSFTSQQTSASQGSESAAET